MVSADEILVFDTSVLKVFTIVYWSEVNAKSILLKPKKVFFFWGLQDVRGPWAVTCFTNNWLGQHFAKDRTLQADFKTCKRLVLLNFRCDRGPQNNSET